MMFKLVPYRYRNNTYDIDRIFDSMFEEFFLMNNEEMKVDIKENEKEYLLEAELPGINKNDINLELRDDILVISAKRKEEIDEEEENYIRKERRYGSISRSFNMNNIDKDKIKAKFDNGILYITLPKLESSIIKSKKIKIE